MNWRAAKLLREHLIMDNEPQGDQAPKPFEQMPRQPLSTGNEPERDPEIIAKRVAEMQQTANPPSTRTLTIIWEEEKAELYGRLEALEADVKFLKADIKTILHAQSQYLAHRAAMVPQSEQDARFAKLQHLKHGIPEVDYEGPTEGPHR